MNSDRHALVIGGAGYVGSALTRVMLGQGWSVRVLDALLYGNGASLAGVADAPGFSFHRGDMRSAGDVRAALDGVTDVVVLAALVGDPVCKRNPELARSVNLDGVRNAAGLAAELSPERLVFASTCSNYGLRESNEPASEDAPLKPLSLYAETKVEMEQDLLGSAGDDLAKTVLRVSTAYGTSPRMRFDLTVSEFTRQLALGKTLEVYDADTWRPYCHVADISEAIVTVLGADRDKVEGEVFNVGGPESNHTKRTIAEAALEALDGKGDITWVEGGVDPRNYRVSFEKIDERLGFKPRHTVPGSIASLAASVQRGVFDDVEARPDFYGNNRFVAPLPGEEEGSD
jgi:nucleoside-diphosphate-sugar epimerase